MEPVNFLSRLKGSMFALKSEAKLTYSQNNKFNSQSVVDKILLSYKRLKKIAKSEINSKDKIKDDSLEQKIQILTQINNLLNDYSKLLTKDDFSKFFE